MPTLVRRKLCQGLALIAAHKGGEAYGEALLTYDKRNLAYPYRVTWKDEMGSHIGQHKTFGSAHREFKGLVGKNETRWSI